MSSFAVRKAIVVALRSALSADVYAGRAPEGTAYPYVVVGAVTDADMAWIAPDYQRQTTRIGVFSDSPTDVEVQTLLAGIRSALHEQRLSLDSGHLIGLRVRSTQAVEDIDERTFTGSATVEALHN